MKEKISKLIFVIKKDGIYLAFKKIYRYIKFRYLSKLNVFSSLYTKIRYTKYSNIFDTILSNDFDRIIIWRSTFGWNVPLFQRPQHISTNLARQNCLIFYEVTTMTDKVNNIKALSNNLYLINFNNIAISKLLFKKIKNLNKPKYIQIYSTDFNMPLKELKRYINDGYKIIYEYIDDLSPELVGTEKLPKNQLDKYNYILKDTENVFVVVTANELKKDILSKRGNEKLVFSCNGVDLKHFQNIDKNFSFEKKYEKIISSGKPIIGYYGALASWFDYNLIKYLAKERPEYNVVLLGIKYDDSFNNENLENFQNIFFLGPRDYDVLPNYASKFNVCIIPFLINNITQSTSPLKLFEYMALGKPIVTTAMTECKKYKSVMIANNKGEFLELVDKAISLSNKINHDYFDLLNKEALENTWFEKSKLIIELIKKYEN